MIYLYSFLMYLAIFLLFIYNKLFNKNSSYTDNILLRFGLKIKFNNNNKPVILIHAVSVGETRAIIKLVQLLETNYPNYTIVITSTTNTGLKIAKELFPNAVCMYLPFDLPHAIKKFYKIINPKIILIMETEIWPNLISYAHNLKIPLYLINARLSDKSYNTYNKIKWFVTPLINKFNKILSQDEKSATNFYKLGYNTESIFIVGNIKFDITIDDDNINILKNIIFTKLNKKIIIFSSTRDGEEELILKNLSKNNDKFLALIVPRHPNRFITVESLIKKYNLIFQKRSDNQPIKPDTQVVLGDSIGEMMQYYYLSDIAVVCGSFMPFGAQNLIEAIYMGKPVIIGPSVYNFEKVTQHAKNNKCVIQVANFEECFKQINYLLDNQDTYINIVNNCKLFTNKYNGSSLKIFNIIKSELSKS